MFTSSQRSFTSDLEPTATNLEKKLPSNFPRNMDLSILMLMLWSEMRTSVRLLLVPRFIRWFPATELFPLRWLSEWSKESFTAEIQILTNLYWLVSQISLSKLASLKQIVQKLALSFIQLLQTQWFQLKTTICLFSTLTLYSKKNLDLKLWINGITIFSKRNSETLLSMESFLEIGTLENLLFLKLWLNVLVTKLSIWKRLQLY